MTFHTYVNTLKMCLHKRIRHNEKYEVLYVKFLITGISMLYNSILKFVITH